MVKEDGNTSKKEKKVYKMKVRGVKENKKY